MFRPKAGTMLGPYRLEHRLGHGITSEVWQAMDEGLRRRSAVKFPTIAHVDDTWRSVFMREAQALALCSHRNIAAVYMYGERDGMPFVAMELLLGDALSTNIALRRSCGLAISAKLAFGIIAQICHGLAEIHHHGVSHFDVKPANVMLVGWRAVLVDFGLCRLPEGDASRRSCVGTPRYMAPEVALGNDEFGSEADVYSAGCVAYELLSGSPPFSGETASGVMRKHIHDQPRLLEELRRDLPPGAGDLIRRMMSKARAERPTAASAASAADAIADATRTA